MNKRRMVFTLLLCATTLAFAADIYKWKDVQGHVHYGDNPAAGAKKIDVNVPTGQTQANDHEKTPPADEKQAKRLEDCKHSKEQLTTYQNAATIMQKDVLGNEKALSAEERTKLLQITQQKIKDACEPPPG